MSDLENNAENNGADSENIQNKRPILDDSHKNTMNSLTLPKLSNEGLSMPAEVVEWKGVLLPALTFGFRGLAPNWNMTDKEVDHLAEVYALVVAKNMKGGIGEYGVEVMAIAVTMGIFSSRVGVPRKIQEVKEEGASDANNAAAS